VVDALAVHPPALIPVTEYVVVALGLTTMLAEVDPLLHAKLEAPDAVSVVDPPTQIIEGAATMFTLGAALTFTVIDSLVEQPLEFVPVTVYVVVTLGLTEILALVAPVFHEKLDAPEAVSVADAPAQIVELDALTERLGEAFTTTVTLEVAEQPLALVPVTEYVVVTLGLTEIDALVAPVLHTKLEAPLALSAVEFPSQITDGEALTEILGTALTFIVNEALAEQPLLFVPVTE
jgi:hypothetical protein